MQHSGRSSMVEHQPSKLSVAGSTPAARSNSGREILLRVEAPNFCAGAVFLVDKDSTFCIESAPILRKWVSGKTFQEAQTIFLRRGFRLSASFQFGVEFERRSLSI